MNLKRTEFNERPSEPALTPKSYSLPLPNWPEYTSFPIQSRLNNKNGNNAIQFKHVTKSNTSIGLCNSLRPQSFGQKKGTFGVVVDSSFGLSGATSVVVSLTMVRASVR
ncbi:hypothetical protein ACFXTH_008726 [Malus domestica]